MQRVVQGVESVDEQILAALCERMAERIPGFAIHYKDESRQQRLLGWLLRPFVAGYMRDYTTAIYPRVYFPTRADVQKYPRMAWQTLAHEYVHLWDAKQSRWRFSLGYLMPQLAVLGALGAVSAWWTPWGWLFLLFLLALAPWPAPWRTWTEVRGYTMDLCISYWLRKEMPTWGGIRRLFTGWAYYRMCPSADRVDAHFDRAMRRVAAQGLPFSDDDVPFVDVRAILADNGLG